MNLLIIQARMGSTRLPGKVLKNIIDNIPILHMQYKRISPSQKVNKIIVATSNLSQDDVIESFCTQFQIPVFRGDEQNVLKRFYDAASFYKADTIIRITADCPLHHYKVIDWCIDQFEKLNVDYFSNSNNPPVLEDGWDTEVFSFKSLESAYNEASKSYEKEHVTPYIKQSGKFTCHYQKYLSTNPNSYKLSVDNENDFFLVKKIFQHFTPDILFPVENILNLLKENPELLNINKTSKINEGYYKSLNRD
jgi:spore coat polysaccharide biosynthesis protein SpsF (cytidylyltransferase family)